MTRIEILKQAKKLTGEDRNKEYGEPWENLTNIATLIGAYLYAKYGGKVLDPMQLEITAEDIAWFNVLQKMARTFIGRQKMDTYVDAAAYAAIAGEVAQEDTYE